MGNAWSWVVIWRAALLVALVTIAGVAPAMAIAQQSVPSPSPAPNPAPRPQSPTVPISAAKAPVDSMRTDWPNLKRFHSDDVALPAPMPGEKRVVFMGDSITEAWLHNGAPGTQPDPGFFPGKPYINRGISGQTTPQMLVRFRQDVIELKPGAVVIFAGTNDIAGNTGDMTPEQTEDNLSSMADLAHANGIKVVLCSILPAFDFPWKRGREPVAKIVALNSWIKEYAASHGYVYVDFYSAMVDARGGLPANLSKDGVHPGKAGYEIMNPLVEAGIEKALGN
jgi:lysophospholipase L1-like esterase